MKLTRPVVSSTQALFRNGLQSDVGAMQHSFRMKLDAEYVKPNPFVAPATFNEEGDMPCQPLSQ